ncbi:nuclease-related domain-containing protein [Cellulomonas taurus]|uniref:nuclease-related domain-containing protein n=1 Tax=Cellulomonas taurus TaxID=2729175 RepID=UPI00145C587B|nr:nuclease-related domain-containing protein [Cellulomonas taurus]
MSNDTEKTMRLRYAGRCRLCAAELTAGTTAVYDRASKTVRCVACCQGEATTVAPVDTGIAGASAAREYQRRSERREQRIRAAHPRLGGLILAVSDEPQSTRAWAIGAEGERRLAATFEGLSDRGVRLLHDRRIPGTRANIDHLVVSSAGVFVVDAKHYRGRPTLRVTGGLIRPRVTTLRVGGRDCTRLVSGVHKQIDLVRTALAHAGEEVPVHGMLCFVAADWPLIGGSFTIDGVRVLWPKKAIRGFTAGGDLADDHVERLHRTLATAFPAA